MPQGTPEGVPAYRRPIGRRHSGAADRRRPNMGGRFLGTPMGVLCVRPPGMVGGTVCGAADRRHGVRCLLLEALCTAAGDSRRSAGDGRRQRSLPAARCTVPGNGRHGMVRVPAMAGTAVWCRQWPIAGHESGGGHGASQAPWCPAKASWVRTLRRPAGRCGAADRPARYLARPVASGRPAGRPVRRLLRQAQNGKKMAWTGELGRGVRGGGDTGLGKCEPGGMRTWEGRGAWKRAGKNGWLGGGNCGGEDREAQI